MSKWKWTDFSIHFYPLLLRQSQCTPFIWIGSCVDLIFVCSIAVDWWLTKAVILRHTLDIKITLRRAMSSNAWRSWASEPLAFKLHCTSDWYLYTYILQFAFHTYTQTTHKYITTYFATYCEESYCTRLAYSRNESLAHMAHQNLYEYACT